MSDVLSQNEIDSLLAALSTGELDVDEIKENSEKQVKEYDFARPSKFSKEHLRTLEIIFEHYGICYGSHGRMLLIYSQSWNVLRQIHNMHRLFRQAR